MLAVSIANVLMYMAVVLGGQNSPILSVHILILHLLLTPLLYSYGFAPLKKRIRTAFGMKAVVEESIL